MLPVYPLSPSRVGGVGARRLSFSQLAAQSSVTTTCEANHPLPPRNEFLVRYLPLRTPPKRRSSSPPSLRDNLDNNPTASSTSFLQDNYFMNAMASLSQRSIAASSQRSAAALESIHQADRALEAERARMRDPANRLPYLQPSVAMLRLAAEVFRSDGRGLAIHWGDRALIHSIPFWILAFLWLLSLLSIVASVAVVVRDTYSNPPDVAVGTGVVFWLVISIVLFFLFGVATIFVMGRKMGYFTITGRRLGMDEVGLLQRDNISMDTLNRHGQCDLESTGQDGHGGARLRRPARAHGTPRTQATWDMVRDPEWQNMYMTPEQARARRRQEGQQTPSRTRTIPRTPTIAGPSSSMGNFGTQSSDTVPAPEPAYLRSENWPLVSPSTAYRFAANSTDSLQQTAEQRHSWSPLDNSPRPNVGSGYRNTLIGVKRDNVGRITNFEEQRVELKRKGKSVLESVKNHFTEEHGRSLGSVVKEKMTKKE